MINEISLIHGKIIVDGEEFCITGYSPIAEIARGASGVVFKMFNKTLNRYEVLKIWLKLRVLDKRDKNIQGYFEANKLAISKGVNTAQVYSAGTYSGYFYALIEYIEGPTLRQWIASNNRTLLRSLQVGHDYIMLCEDYGDGELLHGDPHWNNVIFSKSGPILIDFGTSHFNGRTLTKSRHWRIAAETFARLIEPFPFFELIDTEEFDRMLPDNAQFYFAFQDRVERWLRYLGIVPPARGVSIFYSQNVGPAHSNLGNDVRAILDRVEVRKLKDDEFLGRYWHL